MQLRVSSVSNHDVGRVDLTNVEAEKVFDKSA